MWYRIACFILLLIIVYQPLSLIFANREQFFAKTYLQRYTQLRNLYYSSHYVKKDNPSIIPDNVFEAFVGGAFFYGTNPILIVHEHPPMGRYIIALSILLFNNESTLIIPSLGAALFGIYLIGKRILYKALFALIPVAIFANEALFISKVSITPLIESIQLPFIVFALYFFMKGVNEKKYLRWFVLFSISLGFIISIRFFILGGVLLFSTLFYMSIFRRKLDKRLFLFLLTVPLCLLVLVLSYSRTIQDGYTPFQILGVQKYIFFYHQSKFLSFFSFWDLILFNKWHTWWGLREISYDTNWHILWPISVVLTGCSIVYSFIRRKLNSFYVIIALWVFMYVILLSVGISTSRYFLPLLPFLYIIAVSFIVEIVKYIYARK